MALTACPECGHQISTAAAVCPGCGAPVAKANPPPLTAVPPPLPAVPPPLPVTKRSRKALWVAFAALFVVVCLVMLVMVNAVKELASRNSTESNIRASSSSPRREIIGNWIDNKSGIGMQLYQGGNLATSYGAKGTWSQSGDNQLSFSLQRNGIPFMSADFNIQWIDDDNIVLTSGNEKPMRWTRSR